MITKNTNNQNISPEFIENLRNGSPLLPKLLVNGTELVCIIDEITVEKGSIGGDTFEIGCAVGDILTATLRDVEVELKGKRLDYQLGMLVGEEYEYISLGVFNISEAPRSRNIVKLTGYSSIIFDTGRVFDKELIQSNLLSDIITAVSNQLHSNIIVDPSIDTTVRIENMPPEMTLYQAIQFIAFICGGYAVNDNLGNVLIKHFAKEANLDVDGTLMTSLPEIEERPFTLECIGCEIIKSTVNEDGEEEQYSEYFAFYRATLVTHNDDIFTDHQGNEITAVAATDIDNATLKISSDFLTKGLFLSNWGNILGYSYYPANIPLAIGDPRLEAVDVLNVTDVDGQEYTVPCHRITHTYRGNFTSTIVAVQSTLEDREIATSLPISSKLEKIERTAVTYDVLQYATDLIRGGLGGYVVMTPGENGYPEEILIMDTPDKNTAVNVWRFNQGGLGHSHSGYDGPFNDIALTRDGKINASMITTGTLSDVNNNTTFNLQTGALNIKKGSINLGSGNFSVNDAGTLTMNQGSINLGSGNFSVTNGGAMTAKSGSIAGLNITESALQKSDSTYYFQLTGRRLLYAQNSNLSGVRISGGTVNFVKTNNSFSSFTDAGAIWGGNPVVIHNDSGSDFQQLQLYNREFYISTDKTTVAGNLTVQGSKSRNIKAQNYGNRLLYCYETPTPLFGDIGEAVLDEEGLCYVEIDDIFTETVADTVEYQVFLQKEGEGDCYIAEKDPRYFVIKGKPGLKVAWELKAKQKDYENIRLETPDTGLDEYYNEADDTYLYYQEYINEQEALLYDY